MTRILARLFAPLLVAVLLLPANTTTHRNAAAIALCIGGFAADVAPSIASGTPVACGALGFVGCELGDTAFKHASFEVRESQQMPPEESSR